jgi:hypothetical protein
MRACFEASDVHESLPIDAARVNRNYARFRERDVTGEELALLAFAKINAGEAWGVEQVARARERERQNEARPGLAAEIEPLVVGEEHFHTRLLVGAAGHFHGADGTRLAMTGAWRPPAPLRLLIGGLVLAPRTLFHPLLLASEVGGVLAFDWLLRRLRALFPHAPAIPSRDVGSRVALQRTGGVSGRTCVRLVRAPREDGVALSRDGERPRPSHASRARDGRSAWAANVAVTNERLHASRGRERRLAEEHFASTSSASDRRERGRSRWRTSRDHGSRVALRRTGGVSGRTRVRLARGSHDLLPLEPRCRAGGTGGLV